MVFYLWMDLRLWVSSERCPDDLQVPRGHVWVEGDNPERSVDSNTFGAVPAGLIEVCVAHV